MKMIPMDYGEHNLGHDWWMDNDGDRITRCKNCGAHTHTYASMKRCPSPGENDTTHREWRDLNSDLDEEFEK